MIKLLVLNMRLSLCLLVFWLLSLAPLTGQPSKADTASSKPKSDSTVVRFSIKEKIGPSAWRKTEQALELAEKKAADYILLHLNTYGGRVAEADSIRSAILGASAPVFVLIDPNAASAGALISIACDKIYMTPSATMGAATVVNQQGKKAPEKYQSYMRGTMRATAQANGRDPKIAEAMVDASIDVEDIAPKGELLTFTRPEAIKYDYCDGKAESVKEVLQKEGLANYQVIQPELSFTDKLIQFLINPAVSSFLILLMLGGLYFELQSPGLGFPLALAIAGAILYFAPLYVEALAAYWEIALFVLGVILIGIEIFVIPGFGVTGLGGLLLVFSSLVLTMLQNDFFDFRFTRIDQVLQAILTVLGAIGGFTLLVLLFGKPLFNSNAFQKMVLQTTLSHSDDNHTLEEQPEVTETSSNAPEKSQSSSLVGQTATAHTELSPSGKIWLNDNMHDAVSEGEFIEQGTQVKVLKDLKNRLLVRPVDDDF
jgi:membrane-bound serine protease (ClpP class)